MRKNINLINTNVITLDENNSETIHSISIKNGKIYKLNELIHGAPLIDLKGYTIIPGFTDSHFHLKSMGKQMDMLNLKSKKYISSIINIIKSTIKSKKEGEWIIGYGWDQTLWEENYFPDNDLLDMISPVNPVVLTRIDGHCIWTNRKAIEKSSYDINNLNSTAGGEIINNCIFLDNAMAPIKKIMPEDDINNVTNWIKNATNEIVKRGITNVHDAWQDETIINSIKLLISNDEFPIRCYGMVGSAHNNLLHEFFNNGAYLSDRYTIRAVKAFIDGALGSRGAALLKPYSDDKHNCGLILISQDKFSHLAKQCNKYGFQLCTHAIGDKGNKIVLDTYLEHTKGNDNHRWRVEHAQMVENVDIDKFVKGKIIPSMQPSHCTSDMRWLNKRVGANRIHRISRWKTFVDAKLPIAGGSDCPIEKGNPIFEYFSAVTRQDHNMLPKDGWEPQERLDRISALKMFTTWAAFSEFKDKKRGKICSGYDADLTILSKDILKCNIEEILDISIIGTMVQGEFVYNNLY